MLSVGVPTIYRVFSIFYFRGPFFMIFGEMSSQRKTQKRLPENGEKHRFDHRATQDFSRREASGLTESCGSAEIEGRMTHGLKRVKMGL
jgi:hypothetical protein